LHVAKIWCMLQTVCCVLRAAGCLQRRMLLCALQVVCCISPARCNVALQCIGPVVASLRETCWSVCARARHVCVGTSVAQPAWRRRPTRSAAPACHHRPRRRPRRSVRAQTNRSTQSPITEQRASQGVPQPRRAQMTTESWSAKARACKAAPPRRTPRYRARCRPRPWHPVARPPASDVSARELLFGGCRCRFSAATSALRLGSPAARVSQGTAYPGHICTGTGSTAMASDWDWAL
jgi:hypothetical protein